MRKCDFSSALPSDFGAYNESAKSAKRRENSQKFSELRGLFCISVLLCLFSADFDAISAGFVEQAAHVEGRSSAEEVALCAGASGNAVLA